MTTPVLPTTMHRRPVHPGDAHGWADLPAAIDCAMVLDGGRPVAHQVLRLRAGAERNVLGTGGGVQNAAGALGVHALPATPRTPGPSRSPLA